MCLDCGIQTTVDLCSRVDCLEATIGPGRRDDLVLPHLPSHRVVKVRRVIHRHREFGKMYRDAQFALIRLEEALADADDLVKSRALHEGDSQHPRVRMRTLPFYRDLSCVGCKKQVSRPCWYCIECDGQFRFLIVCAFPDVLLLVDECFVCPSCEASEVSFSNGHKPIHGLVRSTLPRDDMDKGADIERTHSRLNDLEAKLEVFQRDTTSRFHALDGRFSNHSVELEGMRATTTQKLETLDTRLERIESLLAALASKM